MSNRQPVSFCRRAFATIRPLVVTLLLCLAQSPVEAKDPPKETPKPAAKETAKPPASSYDQISPVLIGKQSFADMVAADKADKPGVTARQQKLLDERYDLKPHPHDKIKMSRGKAIQTGPTAKLPAGMTWAKLAEMSPSEVRDKGLFPLGYLPLPHPKHLVGGMVFPKMQFKQFPRLERFDVEFDLP